MSTGSVLAAIELLTALLTHAAKLSATLQAAQAEDRELTPEEWNGILLENDAAMDRLQAEIARARDEGR